MNQSFVKLHDSPSGGDPVAAHYRYEREAAGLSELSRIILHLAGCGAVMARAN